LAVASHPVPDRKGSPGYDSGFGASFGSPKMGDAPMTWPLQRGRCHGILGYCILRETDVGILQASKSGKFDGLNTLKL